MSAWTCAAEYVPESGAYCLVQTKGGSLAFATFDEYHWRDSSGLTEFDVVEWMSVDELRVHLDCVRRVVGDGIKDVRT